MIHVCVCDYISQEHETIQIILINEIHNAIQLNEIYFRYKIKTKHNLICLSQPKEFFCFFLLLFSRVTVIIPM